MQEVDKNEINDNGDNDDGVTCHCLMCSFCFSSS